MENSRAYARREKSSEVRKMRHANSIVENWFGVVKNDFLSSKRLRLRPGCFIRKCFASVKGRLREMQVLTKPRVQPTQRKRKHEDVRSACSDVEQGDDTKERRKNMTKPADDKTHGRIPESEYEEQWRPKKQKPHETGKIFHTNEKCAQTQRNKAERMQQKHTAANTYQHSTCLGWTSCLQRQGGNTGKYMPH